MLKLIKLGDLSKKYEVGSGGPGTVGTTPGDPGGVSYGSYQLSSRMGTLKEFLDFSGYALGFRGLKINSQPFMDKWKQLAKAEPYVFEDAQWSFIKHKKYDPVRDYAAKLNILDYPAINQVLWSMAVQHGKAQQIVHDSFTSGKKDPKEVILGLYKARIKYVKGINLPKHILESLMNRYSSEQRDALAMIEE